MNRREKKERQSGQRPVQKLPLPLTAGEKAPALPLVTDKRTPARPLITDEKDPLPGEINEEVPFPLVLEDKDVPLLSIVQKEYQALRKRRGKQDLRIPRKVQTRAPNLRITRKVN